MPSPGAGRNGVEFLERYTISPDQILYQTATSIVLAGTDKRSDHAPVALKFMRSKADYLAETKSAARNASHASCSNIVAVVESERVNGGLITQKDVDALTGSAVERICSDLNLCGTYLVILERGSVDLLHEISHKVYAHHSELIEVAKDVASTLQYMNEAMLTAHGDVKLRNFVKTHNMDGTIRWKAIDLDGSARHGDPIGAKLSTACCPPEMARLRYKYLYGDCTDSARPASDEVRPAGSISCVPPSMRLASHSEHDGPSGGSMEWTAGTEAATMSSISAGPEAAAASLDSNNDGLVPTVSYSNNPEEEDSSAARQRRWVEWMKAQDEDDQVHANVTYDVWSFGVLLYALFVPGATSMFLASANDDILNKEDLYTLAYRWEFRKLAMTSSSKIQSPMARDLILWCLQSQPSRRPRSFTEILQHPLFQEPAPPRRAELRLRSRSHSAREHVPEPEPEPEPKPEPQVLRTETIKRRLKTTFQGETPSTEDDEDSALMRHQSSAGSDTKEQPMHFRESVVERAFRLHSAIEGGDLLSVKQLFNNGGVHVNLTLFPREEVNHELAEPSPAAINRTQLRERTRSLLPIHRAARLGHVEIVQFLCNELPRVQLKAVLDQQIDSYRYTALHVAAIYGCQDMVDFLISEGCDTGLKTYRGKTAWGIAIENGQREVCAVFERWAAGSDDGHNLALHTEGKSRSLRPNAKEMAHEDLELDLARCGFWETRQFDEWQELPNPQPPFIRVYSVPVFPPIQRHGHHFNRAAIKVAQDPATRKRLLSDVGKLANVSHRHVCHVLGFIEGSTPEAPGDITWLFAWEVCEHDLSSLLFGSGGISAMCSRQLMLELTKHIAAGMAAIHERDVLHLNLNPSDVLLSQDPQGQWVAKVANYGLAVPGGPTAWVGNPCYMAPEWATGSDDSASPDKPADVFSYAILVWEMFTRQHVRSQFPDLEVPRGRASADGQDQRDTHPDGHDRQHEAVGQRPEDVRVIAAAYYEGRRPIVPSDMSKMLRLLLEACWDTQPSSRPTFKQLARLLSEVENATWLLEAEGQPDAASPLARYDSVGTKSDLLRREAAKVSASYRWKELQMTFARTRVRLPDANEAAASDSDTVRRAASVDSIIPVSEAATQLRHDNAMSSIRLQLSAAQEEVSRSQLAMQTSERRAATHAAVAREVAAAGCQAVGSVHRHELRRRDARIRHELRRRDAARLSQQQSEAADITAQALALMQRASQTELQLEQQNAQLLTQLQLARAALASSSAQTELLVEPPEAHIGAQAPGPETVTVLAEEAATSPTPRAVVSMDSLLSSHRALATPPSSTLTSIRDAFDPLAFLSSEDEAHEEAEPEEEVHEGVPPDVLLTAPHSGHKAEAEAAAEAEAEAKEEKETTSEAQVEPGTQPDLFKESVAVLAAALEAEQQLRQGDGSARPRALQLYPIRLPKSLFIAPLISPAIALKITAHPSAQVRGRAAARPNCARYGPLLRSRPRNLAKPRRRCRGAAGLARPHRDRRKADCERSRGRGTRRGRGAHRGTLRAARCTA